MTMAKIVKLGKIHVEYNSAPDDAETQDGSIPDDFDPDDDSYAVNESDLIPYGL